MSARLPRRRFLFVLCALALLGSADAGQAQTAADSAWDRGDMDAAERLFAARLAADSNDVMALRRIALLRAWAGRYDESIALSNRLVRLAPNNTDAAIERARVLAWARRFDEAVTAIDAVLAREPTNRAAIEARAQFTSWSGRYDESLREYGRLLEISPGDATLLVAQARVLGWAREYDQAAGMYQRLLAADPTNRELLLGLAQTLSWGGRTDSASVIFRRLLDRDARDIDALKGLARSASWSGRLRAGEQQWRSVLAVAPNDVEGLVGLGATLRWQGRDAAALEVLRRAHAIEPGNPDLRIQIEYAEAALAPRAAPIYTYEADSDDNIMHTMSGSVSARPAARVELRGSGYRRDMRGPGLAGETLETVTYGGTFGATLLLEPGWTIAAHAGASQMQRADADPTTSLRASISTPRWLAIVGTVAYARAAFDPTALLGERRVRSEQLAAETSARLSTRASASAGAATTRFTGVEDNRQVSGNVALTYRLLRPLTIGIAGRAFTFEKDRSELLEGYFNPDFYGIAEATAALYQEFARFSVSFEAAPGLQQIGADGEPNGSLRGSGRVAYTLRPGRQIGVSAAFANSGLQALSPTSTADYKYHAFGVFLTWTF